MSAYTKKNKSIAEKKPWKFYFVTSVRLSGEAHGASGSPRWGATRSRLAAMKRPMLPVHLSAAFNEV